MITTYTIDTYVSSGSLLLDNLLLMSAAASADASSAASGARNKLKSLKHWFKQSLRLIYVYGVYTLLLFVCCPPPPPKKKGGGGGCRS